MKYKINDIFFYEENVKLEELKEKLQNLTKAKSNAFITTLFSLAITLTSLYAFAFTNVGINAYFLIISLLSGVFSTVGLKHYVDLKVDSKLTEKSIKAKEEEIKSKKSSLKKKINIYEKSNNHINNKEMSINISEELKSTELKNKLLILRDYIVHKDKYEYYYVRGVLEAHLSHVYSKNDIEFLQQVIAENIVTYKENTKNKTKIK